MPETHRKRKKQSVDAAEVNNKGLLIEKVKDSLYNLFVNCECASDIKARLLQDVFWHWKSLVVCKKKCVYDRFIVPYFYHVLCK